MLWRKQNSRKPESDRKWEHAVGHRRPLWRWHQLREVNRLLPKLLQEDSPKTEIYFGSLRNVKESMSLEPHNWWDTERNGTALWAPTWGAGRAAGSLPRGNVTWTQGQGSKRVCQWGPQLEDEWTHLLLDWKSATGEETGYAKSIWKETGWREIITLDLVMWSFRCPVEI